MELYTLVLTLLVAQGVMGAYDTIYHHELRCALPQRHNGAAELRLHAARAVLYGLVFFGFAWLEWGGLWLLPLWFVIGIEVLLTLRDFVVEDRTRLLPGSERVLHTLLAINGGVVFGLFAWHSRTWWALPDELRWVDHGWRSVALTFFAVGVVLSGIRDAFACRVSAAWEKEARRFDFGSGGSEKRGRAQSFLVTGGTGFIGQHLVRALLADGHRVTLWTRDPLRAAVLFQGRAQCVASLDELDRAVRFDVIVNLAGAPILGPRWSTKRRLQLLRSRVETTRALLEWLARACHTNHRPRLMISTSAIGYYGIQDECDTRSLDESSPPQAIFMSRLCLEWEETARRAAGLGIPVALTRLGVVFGRQNALPALLLPVRLGLGGRIGSGGQTLSWIHIDDVIGAFAWLCANSLMRPGNLRERGAGTVETLGTAGGTEMMEAVQSARPDCRVDVYNLVAPEPVSQAGFVRRAAALLHRPAWLPLPARPLRWLLGEQADLLLAGQRVLPQRLLEERYRFRFPGLSAALRDLISIPGETT